jgi:hypothetical protein
MKTTIDIADDLVARAKIVQKRDDVTLRALVEEGLRLVLDRHVQPSTYKFEPVVTGKPYEPGMAVPDINALIAQSNERDSALGEFPLLGVAELQTVYMAPAKRGAKRKRRS